MTVRGIAYLLLMLFCVELSAQTLKEQPKVSLHDYIKKVHSEGAFLGVSYPIDAAKNCFLDSTKVYVDVEEVISSYCKECSLYLEFGIQTLYIKDKIDYSFTIVDGENLNPLPFTFAQIDNENYIADENGIIHLTAVPNKKFKAQFSYLGYFELDTIVNWRTKQIPLQSSYKGLEEVVIEGSIIDQQIIGRSVGQIQLNHLLAQHIPGSNDNTIYNLLRLQPGVLAAGEQKEDYMIWGSYKGQTQILYDEIPLFSIHQNHEHIGPINPLMIKSITVHKAAYNADLSGRVGGVVDIVGNEANSNEFEAGINMNNQTFNGSIDVSLLKGGVKMAFRSDYVPVTKTTNERQRDETVVNDYSFNDVNLRIDQTFGKNHVSLTGVNSKNSSLLDFYEEQSNGGFDKYSRRVDQNQLGAALNWTSQLNTNNQLKETFVYSSLDNQFTNRYDTDDAEITELASNRVNYYSYKSEWQKKFRSGQDLELGFDARMYEVEVKENSKNSLRFSGLSEMTIAALYGKYRWKLPFKLTIEPGLRLNKRIADANWYWEPRLRLSYPLSKSVNWHFAYGRHIQFLSENSVVDDLGNARYYWLIADQDKIEVIEGDHFVNGWVYKKGKSIISVELFYKMINNWTRYYANEEFLEADKNDVVKDKEEEIESDKYKIEEDKKGRITSVSSETLHLLQGDNDVIGADLYWKQGFGRHHFWTSYTISHLRERVNLAGVLTDWYTANNNQTHEFKKAVIFNFKPVYFSVNYVHGSGIVTNVKEINTEAYKRLDAALMYQFQVKDKWSFEAGISVLNVLNRKNVRIDNFVQFPESENRLYGNGIPFTPLVFLSARF